MRGLNSLKKNHWIYAFTISFSTPSFNLLFLALSLFSALSGQEIFDSAFEAPYLTNIQQVTFTEMGFEKAGEAYFSPDDSAIIFQAVPAGEKDYQIFTLSLSNGALNKVSPGYGACTCSFFHPDGKKILFASSHGGQCLRDPLNTLTPGYQRQTGNYAWQFTPYMNIYEANVDGSDLKALTEGPGYHAECAYSSDGEKIVFAANVDGSMNIYTMNRDGSDVMQITHTQECYNGGCFFSPDDQKIIFRADREKKDHLQIYLIDSDGKNECQLTDNGAVNWAPYFHPDGKVIAFTTSLHGHEH